MKPISTAPTDGRKVMVKWRDRAGVENNSIARYRSGGDESGWWTFVDSETQKRIEPHSWTTLDEESED